MTIDVEIKRCYKTGKVLVGTKDSERSVLFGESKGLVLSSSIHEADRLRLKHLCKIAKLQFVLVNHTPLEFGKVIGLAHPVSVASIISEGKSKILLEFK
ncbi:MAG: hypothetical protein COT14_02340 [Candidatus Diapherotrites archaeon CG08_land_8_20_14_0_20_30_16]|nr:MAG: hypothetical protein COT14_02340 [Candidatus Diapherotrites archaeon CG08_land_8_20_14_0_20_30_16]